MENKVWFARRPRHWVLLYSQTFRENDDPMIGFPTSGTKFFDDTLLPGYLLVPVAPN